MSTIKVWMNIFILFSLWDDNDFNQDFTNTYLHNSTCSLSKNKGWLFMFDNAFSDIILTAWTVWMKGFSYSYTYLFLVW